MRKMKRRHKGLIRRGGYRMNTKRFIVFLILVLGFWSVPVASFALEAEEPGYAELSGRKLGRGLSNTAFGWIELPGGIQEVGEKHGVGAAATWGFLHGTGRAVQRTAIGIFEVLTFPFGMPQEFEPLIEPEFILTE